MIEWFNRWINPPVNKCEHRGKGYKDREENKCWCGAGLITFYSRKERVCIPANCNRKYDLHDGVEIKHQR